MDCYAVRKISLGSTEQVSEASYPRWSSVQFMGVHDGGLDVLVAQQLLNGAEVLVPHKQVAVGDLASIQ
jgi:hypothetical protein